MITCDVCGRLNDPSSATCAYCGSDLSDSPDWDTYNDDSFDEADEMGYVDPDFYD